MEEGKLLATTGGTPQGGVISPILANLYLHYVLDLWFEHVVKKACRGNAFIVRYADDFVCCFQYESEAREFYKALIERLKKFNLEITEDKTKIMEFGRYAQFRCKDMGKQKPQWRVYAERVANEKVKDKVTGVLQVLWDNRQYSSTK
jgi:retron-type reverse transcriptase